MPAEKCFIQAWEWISECSSQQSVSPLWSVTGHSVAPQQTIVRSNFMFKFLFDFLFKLSRKVIGGLIGELLFEIYLRLLPNTHLEATHFNWTNS